MNNTQSDKSKTVLITGGARRIGAALVKAFHDQGMNVLFQYHRSAEQAEELTQDLNRRRPGSAASVCLDLCNYEDYPALCDAVRRHFGTLDVLINNASAFFPAPVERAGEFSCDQDLVRQWNQLFDINARAPFFLSLQCQKMLSQQQGSIINLTDIYAVKPLPGHAIYCASKAALKNLTLSLAESFSPDIRVNAIAPGAILAPPGKADDSMTELIDRTPLKRLGGESSIVEAALFLANQASFITGQTINVDGGRSIIHP